MFFKVVVLCLGLFLGSASSAVPVPDPFELLVNLFNALFIDSDVSFEYEFGSGVPLLHGKARPLRKLQVTINAPLELDANSSSVFYPNNHTQLCSLNVRFLRDIVISREKRPELVLTGCSLELDVTVNNKSDWRIRPIFAWVSGCSRIAFSSGFQPPVAEQVLPTLSQGILNIAVELFKKDFDESEDIKTDRSKNFQTFQDMFPVLMYLKGRPIVDQEKDGSD